MQLQGIIERKMKNILQAGRQITQDNGEYGAELVRDVIETSGTVKTGKRGRIETGEMLAGVDSEYTNTSDGGEATYGFTRPTYYATYQEYGTQYIEPMHALDDAYPNVEVDFKRDIDKMMRQEW